MKMNKNIEMMEKRELAEIQCRNCGSWWSLPYFQDDRISYDNLELLRCPLCLEEFVSGIEDE